MLECYSVYTPTVGGNLCVNVGYLNIYSVNTFTGDGFIVLTSIIIPTETWNGSTFIYYEPGIVTFVY